MEKFNGYRHLIPYDLDHHAAIDALREFCKRHKFRYRIVELQAANVYIDNVRFQALADIDSEDTLALAICKAIVEAAQKSEKEAGAGGE